MGRKARNIGSRNENQSNRRLDGVEVIPCRYSGKQIGKGDYMSGTVNKELVLDANGDPKPYRFIGVAYPEFAAERDAREAAEKAAEEAAKLVDA